MNDIALEVRGLRVAYGDVVAVWEVDLTARAGEITAVLGRNGAGKTTLLNAISGLIPSATGTIALEGRDITKSTPWKRSRLGLGFVREGKRVFRELSVAENLEIAKVRKARGAVTDDSVDRIYQEFPLLARLRDRKAAELSGGQQQLLALGQALIPSPRVLLVDEPSSGLAPMVFDTILDSLDALKNRGVAVVLVEQLVEEVLGVADRVVVVERGRVARDEIAAAVTAEEIAQQILAG